MIVLSLLIAAITQLNSGSSVSVSQEILSVRALFAAESGAQAIAMQPFPISGAPQCPALTNISFTVSGLNNCNARVTCSLIPAGARTVYTIISEGRCTEGNQTARRRIQIGLRN